VFQTRTADLLREFGGEAPPDRNDLTQEKIEQGLTSAKGIGDEAKETGSSPK
jgi:hypothetical protein